jgi:hypothetical protein
MMWQVELHSRLGNQPSAFELDIAFNSDVQRLVLFGQYMVMLMVNAYATGRQVLAQP